MGNMIDPEVARYLDRPFFPTGQPLIRLTQMTGLPYGNDAKRWGQWQTSNTEQDSRRMDRPDSKPIIWPISIRCAAPVPWTRS